MATISLNNSKFPWLEIKEDTKTVCKRIAKSKSGVIPILLHDASGIPFMVRPVDITFVEGNANEREDEQ